MWVVGQVTSALFPPTLCSYAVLCVHVGAGWGGCIIALVQVSRVEAFKQQLVQQYYQPLVSTGVIMEQELPQCVFATSPAEGARVTQLPVAREAGGQDEVPAGAAECALAAVV